MTKIKIFLASSYELKQERERFEIEINRKNKLWSNKGIFLHLEIWEDLSTRMSSTRSQDAYNKKIKESDLFVLLAFNKVGMYTKEEFEIAFGSFKSKNKPFIFIYFKDIIIGEEDSLAIFKNKLKNLGHFYASFSNFDHLWNQFNKELDRLLLDDFMVNSHFNNSYFENTTFNYNGVTIYKMLGDIPTIPSLFIGRDTSTEEIHQKLTSSKNILLINGTGGIGKTTMASQYYYEYFDFYAHLVWVVSEKGIKDAIISLALSLKIVFPNDLNQDQQLIEILRNLSELKKPVLFIIDNANDLEDLNNNHTILKKIHNVHILLTSRINNFQHIETHKVKHLGKNTAIDLFKYHFKNFKLKEQEILEKVLEAIEYNTLVIELLAKNLNEYNTDLSENYPLKKLLEDIQKKGVLAIRKSTKISSTYKLNYAKPEEIIRTMYDISNLTDAEKQILSIFAVLPALSVHYNFLNLFLPKINELDLVLNKLTQKGWLEKSLKNFKTNPIISEIVREQNKEKLKNDINYFVQYIFYILDYDTIGYLKKQSNYTDLSTIVMYAESFIIYKIIEYHDYSLLLDRLGNFYLNYGNLDKALKYFEEGSRLEKIFYENIPFEVDFKFRLANSYLKLGIVHSFLGNFDKTLMYFKGGSRLIKELYENNPNNVDFKNGLAISYEKLGTIYTSLGNFDKALKYFERHLKLGKELYKNNPKNKKFKNDLSVSYNNIGNTQTVLGNFKKALLSFINFNNLMKELYKSKPNNVGFKNGLSISYERLGTTYISLKNFDKAIKYLNNYLALKKELYDSNPNNIISKNGLAVSYSKLGTIYTSFDNLDKAIYYFGNSLKLMKELSESNSTNVDFKSGLAVSYSKLGATYTSLGNFDKALNNFENDFQLTKELYENNLNNVDFKNGLAISYNKLGETYIYLGDLNKAINYFKDSSNLMTELYNSNPNNVKFKKGLAISYGELGTLLIESMNSKNKGLELLKKSKDLLKELTDKHPTYKEFENYYNLVVEKINSSN